MKKVGIYVHIPFCKKKCAYCDFISYENKINEIEEYIEALKNEIEKVSRDKLQDYIADTIYIGGGTPSYIKEEYISDIIKTLKRCIKIEKNAEITIEINPGTADIKKLEKYKQMGINRLSIGLQTSNDKLLKTIERIHTYEEFKKIYDLARNIGFKNINIDLMIGLPNEKIEDVESDLYEILLNKPEHVSVYSLILEEGTKLEKMVNDGTLKLPSESLERKMYWLVKKELEKAGYEHYEISNFAKKGFESKHNTNCWKQKEYIGFGVAAHSYFNQVRYSNQESLEKYILNNEIKIVHEKQNNKMQMKEFMLLGLRRIEGIRISEFKEKFIVNPVYEYKYILNKLVKQGLLEVDLDKIHLSKKGIDLANLVWEEFV